MEIWCTTADTQCTFTCQNSSRSIYSIALWRRKPPIFAVFGLRHLVMSTVSSNLSKLNTAAQLQTFPYPMASKFLYSNAFTAKSCAQPLTFKSVTYRQTDKQNKQNKNSTFSSPRGRVKSEPHQTWHGDRAGASIRCQNWGCSNAYACQIVADTQSQKRHHNVTSQNDVTRTEQNRLGM